MHTTCSLSQSLSLHCIVTADQLYVQGRCFDGSDSPPKTTATWVLRMPVLADQAPRKLLVESIARTIPIARSSVSVFLNGLVVPVICNPHYCESDRGPNNRYKPSVQATLT